MTLAIRAATTRAAQVFRLAAQDGDSMSAPDPEHLSVVREPTSLRGFVDDLQEACALLPTSRALSFEIECTADVAIAIDSALMARVIGNIVQNAIRYAKNKILIVAAVKGHSVEILVCNDGPPIPIYQLTWLFEKLSPPGPQIAGRGMGLGLYSSRLIVGAHGGRISFAQQPEWPVVFTVTLPVS